MKRSAVIATAIALAVVLSATQAWAPNRREHDHIGQFNFKLEVGSPPQTVLATSKCTMSFLQGEKDLTGGATGAPAGVRISLEKVLEAAQDGLKGLSAEGQGVFLSMWDGQELAQWQLQNVRLEPPAQGATDAGKTTLLAEAIRVVKLTPALKVPDVKGARTYNVAGQPVTNVLDIKPVRPDRNGRLQPIPPRHATHIRFVMAPGARLLFWRSLLADATKSKGLTMAATIGPEGFARDYTMTGMRISAWSAGPSETTDQAGKASDIVVETLDLSVEKVERG